MTDQSVIDLGTKAMWLALKIAAPTLVTALLIGLIVSIFQAATQINEQTLVFVPKILAMSVAMVVFGPWMLNLMLAFTVDIFQGIATLGR
jgi:flagellar biosynthetic protein FliQ